ncbi:MAG: hypothetical protein MRZ79_01810 [Bacteroidia bacterium]|nr:hypothetical protein [Bacteroidia bacterium]
MKKVRLLLILAIIFGLLTPSLLVGQVDVFVENFEDKSNANSWALVQGRKISSSIEESRLVIRTSSKSAGNFILLPMPVNNSQDYDIEMTLTQTKGAKNMAYGLCWAAKDEQSDYMGFFLSSNGKYTLLARKRGLFNEIKRWTDSRLVNKVRRPNHLKVSKRGDKYIYYLNGQRIFASRAERMVGKDMGIALYGKMTLEVNSFKVSQPMPEGAANMNLRVKANKDE